MNKDDLAFYAIALSFFSSTLTVIVSVLNVALSKLFEGAQKRDENQWKNQSAYLSSKLKAAEELASDYHLLISAFNQQRVLIA